MLTKVILASIFLFFALVLTLSLAQVSPELLLKTPRNSDLKEELFKPQPLTLQKIFQVNHEQITQAHWNQKRLLIVTGDNIPARSVNFQAITRRDFTWPYLKTADVLKDADITFVNLESPLVKNCPISNEGMIFCGDERNIQGLNFAGVDVVNLANNHAGNYGLEGIENTKRLLSQSGILATGVDGPAFFDVRGLKFAFLGYNDIGALENGISWADNEKIKKEIVNAEKQADVVVVTFHWGIEYVSQPSERQRELAHLAIDSGADLIIGNHPHWIEPVEIYRNKLITYAHGNFIFDQMWSEKTRLGVVGKYTFYDKKLIDAEFLPVQIDDFGQPHFINTAKKEEILDEMKAESLKLL